MYIIQRNQECCTWVYRNACVKPRLICESAKLPRFQFVGKLVLAVRHPISFLVLIWDLRMSPGAESVGKRLLTKQMTYTESLHVSLL